ncbi:MAG TPA: hypothetical protein VHX86_15920 [Tepidisphaeraceae bacterium]|nr:hypothetical protein [Tepidisphaeraceae bacterium]
MPNPKKAAKPPSAPKKPDSKPASTGAASAPLIDPAQSAAAAAALVVHKVSSPSPAQGPKSESSSFRNLKESLAKPHSQTIGGVLDKMAPTDQKRSGLPFGGSKQVGHNQTFGADVSRRNVPRRTNG